MPSLKAMAKEAKSKKKSTEPKKAPKQPAATLTNFKSTEYIQDSDQDEVDKSDEDSNSDDESLPENPADAVPKTNGKLPAPPGSSSSSEDESESEEDSSSEGDEVAKKPSNDAKKAPAIVKPTKKPASEPTAKSVSFKDTANYKPPPGFELVGMEGTYTASQLFKRSNLEGKQIWYLTAPASVPVSSIQEISLQDAKNGKAILSHNGEDYGFVQDSAEDSMHTKIMVPNSSDDGYRTASKTIEQILHLQQVVKIPGIHDLSENFSSATVPAKKPARSQPKGLKMRFRPIGFGSGKIGEIGSSSGSDEETEDAQVPFKKPAAVESSDSSTSDEEMTEAPPPPSKSKHDRNSTSAPSTKDSSSQSLKRKHGEGEDKNSKNSSYRPTSDIDDRGLKRLKKKQTESQRDRASALTNKYSTPILPPRKSIASSSISANPASSPKLPKSDSAILPPKSPPAQQSSQASDMPLVRSSQESGSKKGPSNSLRTAVHDRENGASAKESSLATEPCTIGGDRQKKVKKLKDKKHSSEEQK